ncbi:MAG: CHRD domain-containing protein [Phycisphaerae bacterium]|nr:CHRD domain-containing protein [Phycisphaerae bacterium]
MRYVSTLLAGAALFSVGGVAGAHVIDFAADLDGDHAVPVTDSTATGRSRLHYNHHGYLFDIEIHVDGLSLADLIGVGPNNSQAQIWIAQPGEVGEMVYDLGENAAFTESADGLDFHGKLYSMGDDINTIIYRRDALYDGLWFLRVYTRAHPAGEIAGAFYLVPAPVSAGLGVMGLICVARRRR